MTHRIHLEDELSKVVFFFIHMCLQAFCSCLEENSEQAGERGGVNNWLTWDSYQSGIQALFDIMLGNVGLTVLQYWSTAAACVHLDACYSVLQYHCDRWWIVGVTNRQLLKGSLVFCSRRRLRMTWLCRNWLKESSFSFQQLNFIVGSQSHWVVAETRLWTESGAWQ